MFEKIFFYAAVTAIIINVFLFGAATYSDIFELQLLSLGNIFLLNFVFLRK
tara:strand:+ start:159 stop:311 length:153 start_codon:yes stop_codon:yes gene_type:complete